MEGNWLAKLKLDWSTIFNIHAQELQDVMNRYDMKGVIVPVQH